MAREPGELAYPATDEWKKKVHAELKKGGRGSQAKLKRAIGCESRDLDPLLNGTQRNSPLVAKINAYYGWAPPVTPTSSKPGLEAMYPKLTPEQRTYVEESIAHIDSPDPVNREVIMTTLRGLRDRKK